MPTASASPAAGRLGPWLLVVLAAMFVTGPILILGPYGIPLLVCGAVALLVGMTTERGLPRRLPVIALGALWLLLGAALLMGTPAHTSAGTEMVRLHEHRVGVRPSSNP
jgi:membrane associated rhomboid family serine protease